MVNAQLITWKAKLGTNKTWTFKGEDTKKNIVSVPRSLLAKNISLMLGYKPAADEKEWKRSLLINDSTGAGIIELPELTKAKKDKTGIWYTITAKQLKEILQRHKKITIHYRSIPTDPEKAALVRVRPVFICTVNLF